mgnify:CR=1 FL=1
MSKGRVLLLANGVSQETGALSAEAELGGINST